MSKKKNKFRKPAIVCPFCIQEGPVRELKEEPGRLIFTKRYFGEKQYPIVRDGEGIRPDKSTLIGETQDCSYLVGCTRCKFQTFCTDEQEAYAAMAELAGWSGPGEQPKPKEEASKKSGWQEPVRGAQSNLPIITTPARKKVPSEKIVLCLIRKERPDAVSKVPDADGVLLQNS